MAAEEIEKKSFLLYTDRWKEIQMLSNEQCGILFKAIFTYVNTGEPLKTDDLALRLFFSFLVSQIDESTRKWVATRKARSEAGKRGGAPKGNKNADKQKQAKQAKQTKQAKQAVTVTDTVTDTVTVSENIPQDSPALERAEPPAEKAVIPWSEIDFELV